MKNLYTLFLFALFTLIANAQTFKPLIHSPYLDRQMAFEELNDGTFISLEGVMSQDGSLSVHDSRAFTYLVKYNAEGISTASYAFKYNDSTKYLGNYLQILSNGNFLVAGFRENDNTTDANHFIKIISADLENEVLHFDLSHVPNVAPIACYEKTDGYWGVFTNPNENFKKIVHYNSQGNLVSQHNVLTALTNPIASNYISSFYFSEQIYLPYAKTNTFTGVDTSFILKVDVDNFNTQAIVLQDSFQFNRIIQMDCKGVQYSPQKYLIAGKEKQNNSTAHLSVFAFDSSGTVSLFYQDTNHYTWFPNDFFRHKIDFKTPNNIYVIVEDTTTSKPYQKAIYNLDAQGNLKWRKTIDTRIGNYILQALPFAMKYSMSTNCATRDGGLLFTFQADDEYDNHGVYYCKLDSNGNMVDLGTNISIVSSTNNVFALYPNPAQNILHIQGEIQDGFQLQLFDLLGKEIKVFNLSQNQIELNHLKRGVYFYNIKNAENQNIQTGKLIYEP